MPSHRDPRSHTEPLLTLCRRGLELAREAGADHAELCAEWSQDITATVQQNDLDGLAQTEETTLGVRVLVDGRPGFATANGTSSLAQVVQDAVAIARATARDPWAGFFAGNGQLQAGSRVCSQLVDWSAPALAERLMALLTELRGRDSRITIDSAELGVSRSARAIVSSRGVAGSWGSTYAHGNVFGMAIADGEVGSFAYDGDAVATLDELDPAMQTAFERFHADAVGALGAGTGESFRGTILLPPSTASSLLIGRAVGALNGSAIRRSRSPFAGKLGELIATPSLTVTEEGKGLAGHAIAPFDREGAPRQRRCLIEEGVMKGILLDHYEGVAAGESSTGSALGSPSSAPSPGVVALSVAAGKDSVEELTAAQKCVLVTRFSGSTNPVTGDFSGVVKGGFLVDGGERRPIKETTISGNVFTALQNISGISRERRLIYGQQLVPTLRVEDVSITAG